MKTSLIVAAIMLVILITLTGCTYTDPDGTQTWHLRGREVAEGMLTNATSP